MHQERRYCLKKMPRYITVVFLALLLLLVSLCLLGLRLAMSRETRYPPRGAPVDQLDTGDLLFFNARAPTHSPINTIGRLLSKGALGTPYCHVSVVYRDVHGLFGPSDALYSYELCSAKGGAVLFQLRQRVHRSLGRLLCREFVNPESRSVVNQERLGAFVLETTEATRRGESSSRPTSCWTRTVIERHVLFLCPDPRNGGTCADHVLRFMEAAGLWRAEDGCFCVSVTDLLLGESGGAGLPPMREPEVIASLNGRRSLAPRRRKGDQPLNR